MTLKKNKTKNIFTLYSVNNSMLFSIIKLIIIFIIGYSLGYLVGNKLFEDIHTVYKGPDSNHIKRKIFGYNDKCYTFETEICFCPRKET